MQGLQGLPDESTAWGLQLVVLEANARAGKAAETKQKLEELGAAHPDRVTAPLYRSTADQLKGAGKTGEAIEVLDLGHSASHDAAINQTSPRRSRQSKSQQDPAALEELRVRSATSSQGSLSGDYPPIAVMTPSNITPPSTWQSCPSGLPITIVRMAVSSSPPARAAADDVAQ